jgi:hypothetical protein
MWSRWICVAAICLGLAPQVEAAERSGLVQRASCTVVRYYVAKYTASAAEAWMAFQKTPPYSGGSEPAPLVSVAFTSGARWAQSRRKAQEK